MPQSGPSSGERRHLIRNPIRGTFAGCCASTDKQRVSSIAHGAKLPSFRLFISPSRLKSATAGCPCSVPEPGQNIHLPLPKKKQAGFEIVGVSCQCSVLWFALTLTLNQRVRSTESRRPTRDLFNGWIETTLGRPGSLTLPQLAQNYMPLCVRIGKIDRLRPALNA